MSGVRRSSSFEIWSRKVSFFFFRRAICAAGRAFGRRSSACTASSRSWCSSRSVAIRARMQRLFSPGSERLVVHAFRNSTPPKWPRRLIAEKPAGAGKRNQAGQRSQAVQQGGGRPRHPRRRRPRPAPARRAWAAAAAPGSDGAGVLQHLQQHPLGVDLQGLDALPQPIGARRRRLGLDGGCSRRSLPGSRAIAASCQARASAHGRRVSSARGVGDAGRWRPATRRQSRNAHALAVGVLQLQ